MKNETTTKWCKITESSLLLSLLEENFYFLFRHLKNMISSVRESTLGLNQNQFLSNHNLSWGNLPRHYLLLTCPNLVMKLFPRFIDVTVTSSLAFRAWAMANAPSSCKLGMVTRSSCLQVLKQDTVLLMNSSFFLTRISLNPRSMDVRASLTTFKLRAK